MALVQTSGKIRTSGSGDVNVTMPSNFTAGNSAIASGCRYEGAITSLTINGTTATVTTQSNSALSGVWIRHVASLTGGSNSATLDTPGGSDYNTFSIEEHSGLDTASLVDTTATPATGSSTSPSITVNPSAAGNLIYGAWDSETGSSNLSISSPASYTAAWLENDANTYQGGSGAYRTAAASGSQSATWTTGTSINWRAVGAVFKAASSGGTGTLAQTLGAAAAASAGALTISGSSARTLGAATLSSAAGLTISGSSAVTLGAASSSSAGALAISGTLAGALGDVTSAAAGEVVSGLSGATSATLGGLTATSAAALAISGAASITLGAASSSSVATLAISGALSASLGALAATSEGAIAGSVEGSVSQTLGQLTAISVGDNSNPLPRRGGGSPRRGYIYKGQRYYLTPEELAVLIAQDVIAPAGVKQVSRKQKAKPVDPGTWAEVEAVLKRLEKLTEPEDDDEEEEALLLLI